MASYRIRFLPDGRETAIAEGQTLLEAAQEANVYVGAICGGEGTCGKCRLIVREGEVAGESTEYLTLDEIRRGYILACQVTPRSDLVVEIPPESRLSGYIDLGKEKDSERFRDFAHAGGECPQGQLDPLVKKLCLTLPEPTLDDPRADQERLLQAVAKKQRGPLQMGLKIARELPRVLRHLEAHRASWTWTWDGHVTATIGLPQRGQRTVVRGARRHRESLFRAGGGRGHHYRSRPPGGPELGNHVRGGRQVQLANSLRRGRGQPHQLCPPSRRRRGHAPRRGWGHRRR